MNTTNEEAVSVAQTIVQQLGFWTCAELGVAKKYAITDAMGGVELHLGGAAETRGWRVRIVLDASDTYSVEAFKVGRKGSASFGQKVNAKELENVYCDQLAGVVGRMVFGPKYVARNEAA